MSPNERFRRALILSGWVLLSSAAFAAPQTPQAAPPKIEVNVNRVFLSVVVRDKQGRPVSDLKKEDFQVLDNDKVQVVSAFTVQKRAVTEDKPAGNPGMSTQMAPPPDASLPLPTTRRYIVFLFDDMHLSIENLAAAKTAGVQALTGALTDPDMAAVVSTSGRVNSGLTRDRAKLKETILSLQPSNLYRSSHLDCPNIDYYQADLIVNKHDEPAFQDAARQELNCNPGIDVKDINIAERQADSDARRTLTLGALDARGLYTTELNASEHSPSLGGLNNSGGSVQLQSDYRRSGMLLAEGTMASLTDGTGGTFFHNRNDLGAGLVGLTEVPECVYLLEFSSDNAKPDGTYHHLKVKVDRDGVQVQARRGYFAPKPDKKN